MEEFTSLTLNYTTHPKIIDIDWTVFFMYTNNLNEVRLIGPINLLSYYFISFYLLEGIVDSKTQFMFIQIIFHII